MWLCERKVSIPCAGARERKWVIKPGKKKKKPRRRAGASDSGIHLIALKWKRFLASRSPCLKKSQIKSHMYTSQALTSHPEVWALIPLFSAVPSVILLLILWKLLFTGSKCQRRQKFSSDAHLQRPEKSLGKEDINTSLLKIFLSFLLFFLSWCLFRLLPDKYYNK